MKSNEIREMIIAQLNNISTGYGLKGIYWQIAQDDALYPHLVVDFDGMRPLSDDLNRRDIKLIVDVYDRNNSAVLVNNLADSIEDLLDTKNLPQSNSLPTIFFEDRRGLPDEDKLIKHIQVVFTIQNYERT